MQCKFYVEQSLLESRLSRVSASLRTAAAVYVCMNCMHCYEWPLTMIYATGYHHRDVDGLVDTLCSAVVTHARGNLNVSAFVVLYWASHALTSVAPSQAVWRKWCKTGVPDARLRRWVRQLTDVQLRRQRSALHCAPCDFSSLNQ